MLRKNQAAASAATSRDGRGLNRFDNDNEKGSKLKRHKESQTRAVLFCLGILAMLGFVAKVKINHIHQYTTKRLRKHSHALSRQLETIFDTATDFLKPNSIYRLGEVEDVYGNMIDFAKFHGMVTLIVNVACS